MTTQPGSGLGIAGQGWKSGLGGTMIGLAGLGTAGNLGISPQQTAEGLLGGAVLGGLGGLLIHLDRQKGKGMYGSGKDHHHIFSGKVIDHLRKSLKKHPHLYEGAKLLKKHIVQFVQDHQHKPIHISDIFGHRWKEHGETLLRHIETHRAQQGEGFFQDLGKSFKKGIKKIGKTATKVYKGAKKIRDKAFHEVKRFVQGKTKFKPSTLANYLASAVGAVGAASAFIPGVDLISVPAASAASLGLKSAGLALKTSGRGFEDFIDYSQLGIVGMEDPSRIPEAVMSLAQSAGPALSKTKLGMALGLSGAALVGAHKLYKRLKTTTKKGKGIDKSGSVSLPPKVAKYIKNNPQEAQLMAKKMKEGQAGRGIKSFLRDAGLIGVGVTIGSSALYQYMKQNPVFTAKLAAKGGKAVLGAWLSGSGLKLAGQGLVLSGQGMAQNGGRVLPYGCSYTPTGKIKCDRYAVWHGIYEKTRGKNGLRKADLMLKPGTRKVISKKKHMQGKKMMQQGKGIYKSY